MNNEEQIAYWNGEAGRKWAQRDAQMANILAPAAAAVLDELDLSGVRAALDVGCGGGSNTFMLAERLGPEACVLGVDISEPMLAIASGQKESLGLSSVGFLEADAASYDFGEAQFDLLFSRFGVMFFDDPVAAFSNMRSAMRPGGALAFACWQALNANPWTALPLKAALTVLPPPEAPTPRAPGPFAFAESNYVEQILTDAGWQDVSVEARTIEMRWPEEGSYEQTVRELVNTGPVSRLLIDAEQPAREAVYTAAESVLRDFYDGTQLNLPGAIWLVSANSGA